MCLERVFKSKLPKSVIGYKVLDKDLTGLYYTFEFSLTKINKDKNNDKIIPSLGQEYISGFHIFLSKKAALNHSNDDDRVFKVKLSKLTAKGYEQADWNDPAYYNIVYVGKELKILKEIK